MSSWENRFMQKFVPEPNSGCWLWTAAVDSCGYGEFFRDGKNRKANRVAWEFFVGQIPAGCCVLHKCDVPSCVNPAHLFIGTQLDNIADAVAKNRHSGASGATNGRAKLSAAQVAEIRSRYATGTEGYRKLSRKFGICPTQVASIVQGKRWKSSVVATASGSPAGVPP